MNGLKFALSLICLLPAYGFGQVIVIDDAGTTHHLNSPAKRIVSLVPHATELLFEVGAGKQIVGASEYSDYPEAANAISRVGGYRSINKEVILMLKPDLIVSWSDDNTGSNLEAIKKLGIPVYVSNPKTFKDIARNLEHLGKLTGHTEKGIKAGKALYEKSQALRVKYGNKRKVRVFYQVWDKPLITINANTFISKSIELCGGENVFASLLTNSPQISVESVLAANPDVIVSGGHAKERKGWIKKWQAIKLIKAVEYENLFQIPPDILQRPTSRLYQGTKLLCQALERARQNMRVTK